MKFENILVNTNDRVTTITINRPNKLNALNILTINELNIALENLSNDESCKIIIITGSGNKAFVAGADISEFYKFSKDQAYDLSADGQSKLFDYIENYPKVIVLDNFSTGRISNLSHHKKKMLKSLEQIFQKIKK